MSWLKSKWTMVVAFGLVTIAALVLLIVGVSTHKEAGLLKVCWGSNGNAIYRGCQVPTEDLIWTQGLPIKLKVQGYDNDPEELRHAKDTVQSAADFWNRQLGFQAIKVVNDNSYDALLVWGTPSTGPNEGGHVSHYSLISGGLSAKADIVHTATLRLSYLVTIHELGHVLGLADDDYEASPMNAVTKEFAGVLQVSGYDRAILRDRYNP